MSLETNEKKELTTVFSYRMDEYFVPDIISNGSDDRDEPAVNLEEEQKRVSNFIERPCYCGKNCQEQFSVSEILESRANFRWLSRHEKNCYILSQLNAWLKSAKRAREGKTTQG
jgi:hypothetical protein